MIYRISLLLFICCSTVFCQLSTNPTPTQKPNNTNPINIGKVKLPIEDEVDTILAWAYLIGDPNRVIGANDMMFRKKCEEMTGDTGQEQNKLIMKYLTDKYGRNPTTMKVIQLVGAATLDAAKNFCKELMSGKKNVVNDLNAKVEQSGKVREKMVDVFLEANRTGTNLKMSQLLCFLKLYMDQTISVHSKSLGIQDTIRQYLFQNDYLMNTLESITQQKRDTYCDFHTVPPRPDDVMPPQSFQLAAFAAINNLTKDGPILYR